MQCRITADVDRSVRAWKRELRKRDFLVFDQAAVEALFARTIAVLHRLEAHADTEGAFKAAEYARGAAQRVIGAAKKHGCAPSQFSEQ